MYNILFVCYGNICRSPMAEMIFKDLVYKNNKKYKFNCSSRATSMEELGNGIYPKAFRKLESMGIKTERHVARILSKDDYDKFDYIIVMEERNRRDVLNIVGDDLEGKIHLLLEFTDSVKDISDPWYTDDFDLAYEEIYRGCLGLFNFLVDRDDKDEI